MYMYLHCVVFYMYICMHQAKHNFLNNQLLLLHKLPPPFIQIKFPITEHTRIIHCIVSFFTLGSKWPTWRRDRGDYVKFVLYKENRDTMQSIVSLSQILRYTHQLFRDLAPCNIALIFSDYNYYFVYLIHTE